MAPLVNGEANERGPVELTHILLRNEVESLRRRIRTKISFFLVDPSIHLQLNISDYM